MAYTLVRVRQAEHAAAAEAAVRRDAAVFELQRQQQSLLSQRHFQQAYEMLARVDKAKKNAEREHRLRVEVAHAQQLGDLRRRQRLERAELSVAYEELEHELRHLRSRRLFELGGPPQQGKASQDAFLHDGHGARPVDGAPWPPAAALAAPDPAIPWHLAMGAWPQVTHEQIVQWPAQLGMSHVAVPAMHAPGHAFAAQVSPPALWPAAPALAVGPMQLVPIPAGWSNIGPARAPDNMAPVLTPPTWLLPAVVQEAVPGKQLPHTPAVTDAELLVAAAPASQVTPATGLPAIPSRPTEESDPWHASPPRRPADSAQPPALSKAPLPTAAVAQVPDMHAPPHVAPADLSDDSSDGSSMSDTSSLGGAFQEERSVNVTDAGLPPPPPAPLPPAPNNASVENAQKPAKNAAPQSSLSAVLAARRASETAALAAAAQRREFTISDFRQLFSLCRHGKYRQVKDLLSAGCPVDGRDQFGNTPLIVACQNGHARIVKVLLRSGANIHASNRSGNTGLHYACSFGFTALADFLISQGADDKARNMSGLTPYEGIK